MGPIWAAQAQPDDPLQFVDRRVGRVSGSPLFQNLKGFEALAEAPVQGYRQRVVAFHVVGLPSEYLSKQRGGLVIVRGVVELDAPEEQLFDSSFLDAGKLG